MQYHANPRKAEPGPTPLRRADFNAVSHGYHARKKTRRTSWKYDLGADIAEAGEPLIEGLRRRGYVLKFNRR